MIKRLVPVIAGAVLLVIFAIPLVMRRIMNIGNATGLLLGSILQ